MAISSAEYDYLRTLVQKQAGIVLEAGKEYLVEARVGPILREAKLDSIAALVKRLQVNSIDPLHKALIDAMTTNETSFFRDQHPFEALRRIVIPDLMMKRAATRTLSIWCAASSSGQEPYTIAMTLFEAMPHLSEWKINFVCTDLSKAMVERSRGGRYSQLEVNRGLPAPLMVKYFTKQGLEWQVDQKLRNLIDFKEMNLLNTWPIMPPLDIIFIRNVLIYFDAPTKKEIFRKIRGVMRPDGYLFLGGAETTMNLDENFQRNPTERTGIYQLKPALAKAA